MAKPKQKAEVEEPKRPEAPAAKKIDPKADLKPPIMTGADAVAGLKTLLPILSERRLKALARRDPAVAKLLKAAKAS